MDRLDISTSLAVWYIGPFAALVAYPAVNFLLYIAALWVQSMNRRQLTELAGLVS